MPCSIEVTLSISELNFCCFCPEIIALIWTCWPDIDSFIKDLNFGMGDENVVLLNVDLGFCYRKWRKFSCDLLMFDADVNKVNDGLVYGDLTGDDVDFELDDLVINRVRGNFWLSDCDCDCAADHTNVGLADGERPNICVDEALKNNNFGVWKNDFRVQEVEVDGADFDVELLNLDHRGCWSIWSPFRSRSDGSDIDFGFEDLKLN